MNGALRFLASNFFSSLFVELSPRSKSSTGKPLMRPRSTTKGTAGTKRESSQHLLQSKSNPLLFILSRHFYPVFLICFCNFLRCSSAAAAILIVF
jgi:hypothetical protein